MTLRAAQESDDSDDQFDFATLPDGAIHMLLIIEWLKCLHLHPDFEAYCNAKRTGDADTCATLEQEHPRIAELYEDWGDIHALPSVHDSETVLEWYGPRQHLFAPPEATVVDPIEWLTARSNTTLVAVPNGLTREQLLEVLDDFVSEHPEMLGNGPKYQVMSIKGERPAATLKRLYQARPVFLALSGLFAGKRDLIKGLPAKVATTILKSEGPNRRLGFNWFVHGEVNKRLLEHDNLPSEELKGYAKTIDNLDKFYRACVDSTIRGIFPTTTPK
ncbi:hypothetical protein [Ralstonia syzygii]|uniref:Uncharacterized protein n=1 Tax=Ralstonia syzygii R24 TaxID=907261 RepID=G3A633_9RALS|nr:hypothetical protein [Ralstonia syzygii]CCA85911.1 hypothetical protein RALSY_40108 [Ralstonia syzygii R24]